MWNETIYQIYPLGFCNAPKENDGVLTHSILSVLDWISHFEKLGVSAILFNPIFESERHGYDTIDFSKIDTRLGTNEDFQHVCKTLHEHNIKVILDGVFNHVGRSFPFFQDVIEKKWDSPYKDWFYINFDQNGPDGFSYKDWEGHPELVELNLQNPEVKDYLFMQVQNWIKDYEIDGLRLDVAYCLDHSFMWDLHHLTKEENEDFFLVGEMIGGDYNVLLKDGMLDSVTNYECRKGLFSSMNSKNLFEIAHSLNRQFGSDPWCLYTGKQLLSFVDNHDVDRLASILVDEKDIPLTYGILYAMPGIPCIYYGSEWKALGKKENGSDDGLRPYFDHPNWNDLTSLIAKLNHLYRTMDVFQSGNYEPVKIANQQFAFARCNEKGHLVCIVNIQDEPISFDLPNVQGTYQELLTDTTIEVDQKLDLEPKSLYYLYRKN